MKKIRLLLSVSLITAFSLNSFSQIDLSEPDRLTCGTAIINNQRLAQNPLIQNIIQQQNALAKQYEKNHISNKGGVINYTIPVVYHIIHDNGSENVSKATIEASIANLNEDFQKLNSDISLVVSSFTGIAADIQVRFRLAHKDPSGNCTEGITRTVSTLTYSAGENVKSLVNWNTTKYLNIWVVKSLTSGAGGYSYYPGWAPSQSSEGVVIRSAQLGNSVTHEVGHFFNLAHCWGSSNDPGLTSNCGGDDWVSDTPNTIGNTSCNLSAVSCGSLDNVQNYMEYSFCEHMFTEGQKSRMTSALNSSAGARNNLWSNANLIATGTNDPYTSPICTPISDFSFNKEFICEGGSVTYTDLSYNAIPTAWNWTFTGGTPNSSIASNPTITYNTAGIYSATNQSSTSAGSGSITKTSIITVSSLTADYSGIIIDGFEVASNFTNDWRVDDPSGGQTFVRTTSTSASGIASVRIRNYYTSNSGEKDNLISPSYDLTSLSTPSLKFKLAFARKSSSSNDRLLVWYSLNCGESWTLKYPLVGASLATTSSYIATYWTPSSSDWVEKTVDLSTLSSATNVRFKFAFQSGGGNNLYLDDINIGELVGINEFSTIASFSIYPNPTNSSTQISFNLTKKVDNLSIKVRNAIGQEITSVIDGQSFETGKYTLKIDKKRKLMPGIYFIEFNADNYTKIQKLIVQ